MVNVKMIEIIPLIQINIIEETLTRMGIGDKRNKILYPSCNLIKDVDGKYHLYHFKELFKFRKDKPSYDNITNDDILRLNSIAILLEEWGMVELIDFPNEVDTIFVYTIPFNNKKDWTIKHKINQRIIK